MEATTTLWKRLWEFDPNGLLVLDEQMKIILVNPALCRIFKSDAETLIGQNAEAVLGDVGEFRQALTERRKIVGVEREYPRYDLYVRKVIFPIPDERIVADPFGDLSPRADASRLDGFVPKPALQIIRQSGGPVPFTGRGRRWFPSRGRRAG